MIVATLMILKIVGYMFSVMMRMFILTIAWLVEDGIPLFIEITAHTVSGTALLTKEVIIPQTKKLKEKKNVN